MPTGRSRNLAPWIAAMATLGPLGCSQSGPFTSRQTTMGSLKASVSQLEFENEKLKKESGELKADNSRLDNQLAQEREANGEIAARLDDAKDMIRRQGGNAQAIAGPAKNYEDDGIPPPATVPQARRARSTRKPPTTQIRRIEPAAAPPTADDDLSYAPDSRRPRDLGPADPDDQDDRWLPVARGLPSQVRR